MYFVLYHEEQKEELIFKDVFWFFENMTHFGSVFFVVDFVVQIGKICEDLMAKNFAEQKFSQIAC
jgi:hypothetical protein